jgi:hypothetical protein
MIEIGRTIISRDLFEEHFLCDLLRCKGACCVEGDSGAPLAPGESEAIERDYDQFSGYLPENHQQEIALRGYSVIDREEEEVTPLVNNRQCAYSFYDENQILKCAIEKAYFEGKSDFRKPVSCHLFPIRITAYKRFDAVNYQQLDICRAGRECGRANKLPLYTFLKEPLIRKYGEDWYAQLEAAVGFIKR